MFFCPDTFGMIVDACRDVFLHAMARCVGGLKVAQARLSKEGD